MSSTRTQLCIAYAAVALLALLATWHQNLAYFGPESGNPIAATARFWRETFATPASASITLDIGLFLLAATLWMVVEARRLGIRFVWLYVVGGLLVAISVTFPLFLIARELRLARAAPGRHARQSDARRHVRSGRGRGAGGRTLAVEPGALIRSGACTQECARP